MSRYLLQISIGPIQEFIAAARRTRDLWCGSTLLSEISKAAAGAVKGANGKLIFPNSDDLGASLTPNSDFNVANVILAEFESEEQVKTASGAAKKAAEGRWLEFVNEAHGILEGHIDEDAWNYQKNGVIEFYSAWCSFKDDLTDYKQARQNVARLLAARKNLRDFEPWEGKAGVPKSSLDGLRENVFTGRKIKSVRVKTGEMLDVVGCVKRASGGRAAFPSVTRIAVDPWVRGLCKTGHELEAMLGYCEKLVELGVLSRVKHEAYKAFPYEGTALLPTRYDALAEEAFDDDAVRNVTKDMNKFMAGLPKPMDPYLAVLVADGDKMGKAISSLDKPERHREFSKTLSKFATDARKIVGQCSGSCIYTGGDDVLAFLPVDTALDCARKLYDAFCALWQTGWDEFREESPTLSVGIAIGHALEDLEILLKLGRDAEHLAKHGYDSQKERNALAVTVRARSNSEISVREQWGAQKLAAGGELAELSIEQRLLFWADHFAKGHIPTKFPYELRGAAKFYENWKENTDEAMRMDVIRIFKRKELKLENDKCRVENYINDAIKGSYKTIERLSDELLTAQWIGYAREAAGAGGDTNDQSH
ncbi:type III-B CRISPR-associated protein Cas10/Cmr2 [Synergistales bacterium]|nr:type III-B CRISPR-associated protein Cas10/Cmr2 [Synergistales bacterium]